MSEKTPERVGTGFGGRKKMSSGSAGKFSWNVPRMTWEVRRGTWSPGKAGETYGESLGHDYKGSNVKKGSKNVWIAINKGSCGQNWFKLRPWGYHTMRKRIVTSKGRVTVVKT